jgi:uncharacterized YigZ family protein
MEAGERYPVPARTTRTEDEVKRSRFIATAAYAPSAEAARSFVQSVRDEFPDATHNCWASVVGPPGSTRENASSDDGEPGGTAGRPMLGALLASGVGDVSVVVTRYFGGTKLGRGGLVRAYSHAVLHVLREMERAEHVPRVLIEITFSYSAVDAVRRALAERGARVVAESYGERATLSASVPAHDLDALRAALADATGGSVRVSPSAATGA